MHPNAKSIDLYALLPAAYRTEDAARGYPLRALLELASRQARLLHDDIGGLWDDCFIETCADWVIPYLGDLVGNNPLPQAGARNQSAVILDGATYKKFAEEETTVTEVAGEFYWRIKLGEKCTMTDFVAPPFIASR